MVVEKKVSTLLLFTAVFAAVYGNEGLTIEFIGDPYEGREGDGVVTITVGLLGSTLPENEIQVMFSTKDISGINNAAEAGIDYNNTSNILLLSNESITIDVELYDDDSLEGDEDFKAMLKIIDMGRNIELFEDTAIVTIVDDDSVVIGFKDPEVQVIENITEVKLLCLEVLDGKLMRTTVVSVTYQDRSAINGQDYTSSLGIFTLSQAVTRACFNISILDDEIVEEEENFLVMLTTGDPQVKLSPSTTNIKIVDNDCPEGMVFKECGSACPPFCDDQSPICTMLCTKGCFCPNGTVRHNGKCISIDDCPKRENLCLATPRVEVTIHVVVRGETVDTDMCDSQHLMNYLRKTIIRDFKETSKEECHFELDSYTSCSESFLGKIPRIVITFETNLTCGDDRCFKHTDLQTSIMEINRQYDLINTTKNIFEKNEHKYNQTDVIVRYFYGEEGPVVYACKEASHEYVIEDSNLTLCKLSIGLAQNVKVMEGNNATLCVNFSSEFATNFRINVEHLLTDLMPIPEEDFHLLNFSIEAISTIHGPDNSLCFNIFVIQDVSVEYEECFEFGISLPDSVSDLQVVIDEGKDTATICIEDDDSVVIGFKEPEVNVRENIINGVKLLCLEVMDGTLMRTTVVSVSYQDRSAINGQDYKSSLSIFTLSQAVTRVCFNVSILDDKMNEEEENFLVMLASGDPQVKLSPSTTNITIMDNDCLEGMVFKECGSACPPSCEDQSPICTKQCVRGCFCPNGTVKHNGECISIDDCKMEELCLATPRVSVNIYVVVRGNEADDVNICDSQHFMHALKRRIYSDFRETSGRAMCHFRLDDYTSCGELILGVKHRTNITFKTNLICGDGCFEHTDNQTSIVEIDRQYNVINATMNINKKEILEYNQTSVVVRYFYQEEGLVVYACKKDSYVQVFQNRNLTLCNCDERCTEPPKEDVTFSFRESVYSFVENVGNATIHVDKANGTFDQPITLLVYGDIQGENINQTVTFGPNDTSKAVTFNITDDEVPFEPTEQFELFLDGAHERYNILFDPNHKTTISITDNVEELCLATPRVAVNIYVVVRGDEADDVDICDSQHFMDALKERIYSDFRGTSGRAMCYFRLHHYTSCGELILGVKYRTAITFKTNLICGDECFEHTDDETSIMEIDQQYDVINKTMNINKVEILEYNQTSVVVRYFYQKEGPVVYACKKDSYVQVFQNRNLTLCNCDERCGEAPKEVTFSFGEPEYIFDENMGNATITVEKVNNGSIDQAITLTVSGFVQGELINKTITFGPNDTEIPITFKITDDVIPLEPTEEFELSLKGTDTEYNLLFEPNDKTTINVVDDDGEHDEDVCLSTPTSEITIIVVVRGTTHVEACDNQHLKHFLERTIHSDFSKISKDKCHLKPHYQASCEPLSFGDIPRTNVSIKVNITCGSSCIQHTYQNTSILEINRQEEIINEISILTVKIHRYNQTSDVVIRYFYGGKKPVFYSCENKEIGSIEGTDLKLCNCSDECGDPVRDVTFKFDKPVYNFIENNNNATIYVEKTNGSIERVITLLVTGFEQGPWTVDFYPQDTKKPINVRILDNDKALEPTEKIELLLSPTDRISLIKPHEKATINIMDDDELLIGLNTQKVTVMEGNNARLCVNFSFEFVTNFTINVNVKHLLTNLSTNNPAIANEDFFPRKFPIEAIPTEHGPDKLLCFNILAKQDEFVEHEECFEVGISVPTSVSDRFMVELDEGKYTTVVCIEDNDRVEIGFVNAEVQIPENIKDGEKSICVNVTRGQLMREVTVMAQYQNHSADDGKDYTGEMHTLTFSQDATLVCFQVAILDDFINEKDEFFTVLLTTTDQNVTLSQDSINITIKDDDAVLIGFIGSPFKGREKDGVVTITFGVLGHTELEEAVSVFINATDIPDISNGAVAGVDYKYMNRMFNLLDQYMTVRIELINDNYLEDDEDFMMLIQIMEPERNIKSYKDNAIVTIVDDDSVTIGFEENDTMFFENNRLPQLCLKVLEGELRRTTVVNVSYQDGSATHGEDYIIADLPDTFNFSQDHIKLCFSFTIINDTKEEPVESFFITAITGDPQVKLSPSQAKVSIKDDDCPTGMIFNNCGSACPLTCNQPTPIVCVQKCVEGCFCTGNKIKHNGECISLDQCPTTTTK